MPNIEITTEPTAIELNIEDLTKNPVTHQTEDGYNVTGEGWFDILMDTATKHLLAQLNSNRFRQEDYANAYVDIYKTTLQLAVTAWLQKAEIAAKLKLLEKQADAEDAKKDLYRRQIEGFDENYKQHILKILLDSWAVAFSVAKDSFEAKGIPTPISATTIQYLYDNYVQKDFDKYNYGRGEGVTVMP